MLKKMKLEELFKYRDSVIGFAMLYIVFFHTNIIINNPIFTLIKEYGYSGIDLLIFCSGLGCYYSLKKDSNIFGFLKRRFIRIFPIYFVFIVVWCLVKILFDEITIKTIFGNFLFIQYFTGDGEEFNWYISAIWLCYFLAPFFYSMLNSIKNINIKHVIIIITVLILITIPFWGGNSLLITLIRVPVFFIGMYIGYLGSNSKVISKKDNISISVLTILGIFMLYIFVKYFEYALWNYGLFWYPFIAIVLGFFMLVSNICRKCKICEDITKVIGKASLEIFMIHVIVFELVRDKITNPEIVNNNLVWILLAVICVIAGIIVNYIYNKYIKEKILNNKKEKFVEK